MQTIYAQNVYVDGTPYLKGLLGLKLLPSETAKRNRANYEADVNWVLKKLYARYVGSRLLMEFQLFPQRTVSIQPRSIPVADGVTWDELGARVDAQTYANDPRAAAIAGDVANDNSKGTGEGTDATIEFNPGVYADWGGAAPTGSSKRQDDLYKRDFANNGTSDRILLHEMVHALSDIAGHNAQLRGVEWPWSDMEEFTAVVIANVYASECGGSTRPLLHWGHGSMPMTGRFETFRSGRAFYGKYSKEMETICSNHPHLAKQLKLATGIAHNPFVYCASV